MFIFPGEKSTDSKSKNVVTSQPTNTNVSVINTELENHIPKNNMEEIRSNQEVKPITSTEKTLPKLASTIETSHEIVCMPNEEVILAVAEEIATETLADEVAEPQFAKGAYEGINFQQNNRLGNADPR